MMMMMMLMHCAHGVMHDAHGIFAPVTALATWSKREPRGRPQPTTRAATANHEGGHATAPSEQPLAAGTAGASHKDSAHGTTQGG